MEQLKKFPTFIEARKRNWKRLKEKLETISDRLILPEPAENSDPSRFGFLLSVRENSGLNRDDLYENILRGIISKRDYCSVEI